MTKPIISIKIFTTTFLINIFGSKKIAFEKVQFVTDPNNFYVEMCVFQLGQSACSMNSRDFVY